MCFTIKEEIEIIKNNFPLITKEEDKSISYYRKELGSIVIDKNDDTKDFWKLYHWLKDKGANNILDKNYFNRIFQRTKNQREIDRTANWKDKSEDYLKSVVDDKFRFNYPSDLLDHPSRSLYSKEYKQRAKEELVKRGLLI